MTPKIIMNINKNVEQNLFIQMADLEELVNHVEGQVPEKVKKIIDYAQNINKVIYLKID